MAGVWEPPSGAAVLTGPLPERLLAVATRLFAAKGFEGTSVQEIVAAAGVTKGAMYHYFAAKDDLLYQIYHRLLMMQTSRLEQFAGGEGTAEERLRAAAVDVIETSFLHLDELTVFFRSMHLLPQNKRRAVRAERRHYHERFRSLVEEGQQAGIFRADVPADIVVHFFFGAVHQLSTWYHVGGPLGAHTVSEYYVGLLLDGLRHTSS
ncbi:TetR/AcrR family transcriptional regulator [Actinomadura sp. HBU206391]|uniref:TetR/AcrR family transcriptional regulator n=1 Tax=Actinomadura sp. HBU206391 TaxID=2731692 RepID=UPI00164F6EA0|nr:TetR/AcrR family transcriptional regulator [Actinomadura sp. HBU206391]MBC6461312.1 TetR/AcrR family transcriptional regulator [Actinomadura sp. HBU206391]